jgi:hypothetical protein
MNKDLDEAIELFLFSLIPIVLIWITLMGVTFCFTNEISYTLGFWVYGILSALLGLIITSVIISKARK